MKPCFINAINARKNRDRKAESKTKIVQTKLKLIFTFAKIFFFQLPTQTDKINKIDSEDVRA